MKKLKIVFIGGTERAYKTLKAIKHRNDIEIIFGIFMNGYAHELRYAHDLSEFASKHKIDHIVCDKIEDDLISKISELKTDLIFGGGIWRSLLNEKFLSLSRYGYISLHGTPLPEYRGMAGINWQIIHGKEKIRMRFFRKAQGIDNGDLVADELGRVLEYSVDINNELHLGEILKEYDSKHILAANTLLDKIIEGSITFIKQDSSEATYSCHFGEDDAEINWSRTSKEIFNLIRSQSKPYKGAFTFYNRNKIYIYRSRILPEYSSYVGRIYGKIIDRHKFKNTVAILTQDSAIEIIEAKCGDIEDIRKIFHSVRLKCMSKEACVNQILADRFNLFVND